MSHDRAFLDNVVTQVIASEGEGLWKEYAGGYEDWQRVRKAAPAAPLAQKPATAARKDAPAPSAAPRPARLTWKEQKELEVLPDRIAALEADQATIQARLNDPALYRDAHQDVPGLNLRLQALEAEMEEAILRWEALESKAAASG